MYKNPYYNNRFITEYSAIIDSLWHQCIIPNIRYDTLCNYNPQIWKRVDDSVQSSDVMDALRAT